MKFSSSSLCIYQQLVKCSLQFFCWALASVGQLLNMSSPSLEISNGSSSVGCPPHQPSGPHPWGLAAMLLLSGSCKQESYIARVAHP